MSGLPFSQWRAAAGYGPPVSSENATPPPYWPYNIPPGWCPWPCPIAPPFYYATPPPPPPQIPPYWMAPRPASPLKPPTPPARAASVPAAGTSAAPPLRQGMNYLWPASHTHIHLIAPPAEGSSRSQLKHLLKASNTSPQFSVNVVPSNVTVRDFMERATGRGKGWVVTEVVETGAGGWRKGVEVKWDDAEKARMALEAHGWGKERGAEGGSPVWLTVWKEKKGSE